MSADEPSEKKPTPPEAEQPMTEDAQTEKKLSRAEIKAQRQAAKEAEAAAAAKAKADLIASYAAVFGTSPIIQSTSHRTRSYRTIASLCPADVGQKVTIRARMAASRKKGKMAFCVLRYCFDSIQGVLSVSDGLPKEMIDFVGSIPLESIVDVEAVVSAPEQPIQSTTQANLELKVTRLHIITASKPVLPFTLDDAARPDSVEGNHVLFDTRLNCRWLDLRTPASGALFRMQSRICQYFREYLLQTDFTEIHSPKIIATASEGGANVFKLDYFGRPAFLAQSPQLYKQMAVQGDIPRVFEVGPVFRAENSNTHRHLTEFVGLDVEMTINEHYFEVLDVAEELFAYIFKNLEKHQKEFADIASQYPFEPFVFQVPAEKVEEHGVGIIEENVEPTDKYGARIHNRALSVIRIPFSKAIALLNDNAEDGTVLSEVEDIDTVCEKKLGMLVKERYGVDFFISDRYPSCARPFYTMPCPDDPRFTNSYDMFMRGEEISSGAQRIHDPELLLKRAQSLNVDLTPISDYVDSFRLGAWPHGGFGVGMERVVMLYFAMKNVRFVSLFPRDPKRVTP